MNKSIFGFLFLMSFSVCSQDIPTDQLAEYKEAVGNKISSAQCREYNQSGYFSLNGYGHSYWGAKGNTFMIHDVIQDAYRGEIKRTADSITLIFYTNTGSQLIETKIVQAPCCSQEISTWETVEYIKKRFNMGTLDKPQMISKYVATGASSSCTNNI